MPSGHHHRGCNPLRPALGFASPHRPAECRAYRRPLTAQIPAAHPPAAGRAPFLSVLRPARASLFFHPLAPAWPCGRCALFPPARRPARMMASAFGEARFPVLLLRVVVVPPLGRQARAAFTAHLVAASSGTPPLAVGVSAPPPSGKKPRPDGCG